MQVVETFLIATFISYLLTPFMKTIAIKLDYLDHPKDNKIHAHPTPLLGGVAIFIAFLISIFTKAPAMALKPVGAILIGSFILLLIGLVDDRMGMMPNIKLLGQFLAAMVTIKSGVRMEFIDNYYLSVIVTYLWIIGITNSFNLLDNMNGLSAGIASIAAIFFGVSMLTTKQFSIAMVSFAIAGASLGFLKHNFPRATIFMGDAGSLVLGFILASTAILGSWNTRFLTTSLAMPIFILGYPIFDTVLVVTIRLIERRSVFQGGRDHSSHRLALLGLKKKKAVLAIYCICILLGFSALSVQRLPLKYAMLVITLVAISMLGLGIRLAVVNTGRFGRNNRIKD